ncbi:MAG: COX15/CtaA family protein [Phycisphaerales bacterium]|nr:COX15/CtaA family protein [Phycisphaerales bacterium]
MIQRLLPNTSTVTVGFIAAVTMWTAWLVTHLPWLGLPESVALPIVVSAWFAALAVGGVLLAKDGATRGETSLRCVGAGLISALLGLLILGSKLTEPPTQVAAGEAVTTAVSLKPAAGLMVAGFLATGALLGLVAGLAAGVLGRPAARVNIPSASNPVWLGRFAVVACVSIVPLIVVGGLVTSTGSGMAVPDWPNTYGTNMFLYPLGPRAAPDVFLEHSHRLFGTLIGLTTLTLTILVFAHDSRKFVRGWAVAAFFFVVLQGVLGGIRVRTGHVDFAQDDKFYRVIHGVLAQGVFCMYAALAVFLSPIYQRAKQGILSGVINLAASTSRPKLLRIFANAALHTTLLQLIMGAVYRHTRHVHVLWTHIALSFVVVVLAILAASAAQGVRPSDESARRAVARLGALAGASVVLQFVLGWVVFLVASNTPQAASIGEGLLRTAHQANGAVLIASLAGLAVWSRAIAPKRATTAPSAAIVAAT